MRHSLTIRNAARPTARIVIELNRNGTAPPISMPMNTSGSATVSFDAPAVKSPISELADLLLAARSPAPR